MQATRVPLQSAVQAGFVAREASPADAVDGIAAGLVIEPRSAEEVAAVLAWATRERLPVVLRGAGTKLSWGRRPTDASVVVSTSRLNRVLAHAHADLTATAEAGVSIEALNETLGRHGQWLPVDAVEGATVGGAVAANDSGPLRHRYGTPRDLLIGVQLALADGQLVKAGGNVVKNVAGYDLGKLVSGSFGTLAAIVSATFKLLPVPATSRTLSVDFVDGGALAAAADAVGNSQLEPVAIDVHVDAVSFRLLIRFATSPAATNAQVAAARGLVGSSAVDVASGDRETVLWRNHVERVWNGPGALVRLTWLPATLRGVLDLLDTLRRTVDLELIGRAGVGSGLLRIGGDTARQVRVIEALRNEANHLKHVTIVRADAAVKERVDVWGPLGDSSKLGAAIKRALDPAGILNAERGPL